MEKDTRVIQAKEILKELEEPSTIGNLTGGFVSILIGCELQKELNE